VQWRAGAGSQTRERGMEREIGGGRERERNRGGGGERDFIKTLQQSVTAENNVWVMWRS